MIIQSGTRHVPLTAQAMSDAQRALHDDVAAGRRGTLPPPMQAWLRAPGLAAQAIALGDYCRFRSSLTPRLAEIAILVTAAHWGSAYEQALHEPLALAAGLAPAVVEAIRAGRRPEFAKAEEHAVWQFATELLETRRVSDAAWSAARDLLGVARTTDLVGVLGYYALVSMTINAFELQ